MTGAAAGGRRTPAPGLRALAALLLLVGLGACDIGAGSQAKVLARQQAVDPPQLWLVQVIGAQNLPTAATFVCADTPIRETFTRARAEVNGEPCRDNTVAKLKEREWALTCHAQGRIFAVSASTLGDLSRDFRLNFALTPLFDRSGVGTVRQTRRFRLMGACPFGWRIGDQAKPGHRPRRSRA
jgi:hypothetical protein